MESKVVVSFVAFTRPLAFTSSGAGSVESVICFDGFLAGGAKSTVAWLAIGSTTGNGGARFSKIVNTG